MSWIGVPMTSEVGTARLSQVARCSRVAAGVIGALGVRVALSD
jgi:hypothetical protein